MKTTITPERAAEILLTNKINRKPKKQHILLLSKQMTKGNWVYNGQSIVLDVRGNLVDGQHRLMACVKAGVPFVTELIDKVSDVRAFETIDTGKPRSAVDLLGMEGVRYSIQLVAISRFSISYNSADNKYKWGAGSRSFPTNSEILMEANEIVERIGEQRVGDLVQKVQQVKGGAIIMFGAVLLNDIDSESYDAFIGKIKNLLFSGVSDPCKRFYEYLLLSREKKNNAETKTQLLGAFFKCWNAYIEGRELGRINQRHGSNLPIPKQKN